jgi:hypothetical protein
LSPRLKKKIKRKRKEKREYLTLKWLNAILSFKIIDILVKVAKLLVSKSWVLLLCSTMKIGIIQASDGPHHRAISIVYIISLAHSHKISHNHPPVAPVTLSQSLHSSPAKTTVHLSPQHYDFRPFPSPLFCTIDATIPHHHYRCPTFLPFPAH